MNSTLTFAARKHDCGFAQRLKHLLKWKRRLNNRRALRREFGGASPTWLAHIERDIGLEPGDLQQEMSKPFWAE